MKRYDIRLDQATFRDVCSEAKTSNKTLFAFANEWLSEITKLSSEGWSPSKLHGLCQSVSLLKEMDVITLPSDFVDELIAKEYKENAKELLKMFRDLGTKIATVVKIDAPDLDKLAELANEYLKLLPIKLFQVSTHESGSTVEITVVGAGKKIESSYCALELIVSVLNSYGYAVSDIEVGLGTMRLWATRVPTDTKSGPIIVSK